MSAAADREGFLRLRELEDSLAPAEFMAALDRARRSGDRVLADAMARSRTARDLSAQGDLRRFAAETIAPSAILFRGAQGPAGRRLLVVFTGRARRPMMPVPAFLQRLDPACWDVLLLSDPRLNHYRHGVDGVADSFPALVRWVASLARGHAGVVALGTSMGGFAAIRFLLAGGAERAVSVGGLPPSDMNRLFSADGPPQAFDPICACLPPGARAALFAFAGENPRDAEAALLAAELCGGHVLAVPGVAEHGVLAPLWANGGLADFLSVTLDPAVPVDGVAAAFAQADPASRRLRDRVRALLRRWRSRQGWWRGGTAA